MFSMCVRRCVFDCEHVFEFVVMMSEDAKI